MRLLDAGAPPLPGLRPRAPSATSVAPDPPGFVDGAEDRTVRNVDSICPGIDRIFSPPGIGTVRTWPPFRPNRRSPSAPPVAGLIRASARATPPGAVHIRSTWPPWRDRAGHVVWMASSRSSNRRPCSGVSQFPSRTPRRRTPLTRRMPAASSGLSRPDQPPRTRPADGCQPQIDGSGRVLACQGECDSGERRCG